MASPLIVYLDQNKWVELLRADKVSAENPPIREALELLRAGVSNGRVAVPLSAAHYLETWNRKDWESRHALAKLMRELSNFVTLSPIQQILDWEIEGLLLRSFRGSRCTCIPPDIASLMLGHGVMHAFNSPTGRLRLVERVAAAGVEEGPPASLTQDLRDLLAATQALPNDAYEWWSLGGFKDSLEYEDLESRSEHRLGTERVAREEALARRISSDKYLRRRLDDYLIAEELALATDDINRIAFWHGASTDLLMESWFAKGPEYGSFLLECLPTRTCIFSIRKAKHSNSQWKWQQHDRTDMAALAVAVPYCDIVVTERQWSHVFRSTHLDSRYSTSVLNRIADLIPLLSAILT